MKKLTVAAMAALLTTAFTVPAMAVEWNVSVWGKRRAFTEHVEKLDELVEQKTNGDFTMNISYGGLSKNNENLDGISIGAFEMAQFCAGYHRDKNPTITVLELPFLGVDTLELERGPFRGGLSASGREEGSGALERDAADAVALPQYNIRRHRPEAAEACGFRGHARCARPAASARRWRRSARCRHRCPRPRSPGARSGVVQGVASRRTPTCPSARSRPATGGRPTSIPGTVNCPVVANTDALNALSDENREALMSSLAEAMDYYVQTLQQQDDEPVGPDAGGEGDREGDLSTREMAALEDKAAAVRRPGLDRGDERPRAAGRRSSTIWSSSMIDEAS